MTIITLDLKDCKTWKKLHETLRKTFSLPDYYGENWDALWDCLRDQWIGADSVTVEITGFHDMNAELKEYCIPMLELFEDVHKETSNVVFKILS